MVSQPRAAETRQKLIEVAVELYVEKGYLETTPKDIVDAAGLTTGAFYYHFTSKEDLGAAIAEQGFPVVAKVLQTYMGTPEPGLENVIRAVFAIADIITSDNLHWIGFYLDHATGHLSPSARQAHRARVEAFTMAVPAAFRESELRDDIAPQQAGELLWIALTGAQLMSGALGERGRPVFERLAAAWNSAMRSVVPAEEFPRFEQFVNETAERYSRLRDAEPVARHLVDSTIDPT